MNDRRFAISMHILVLLSKNSGEWLSSDYLAGSININPVLVRKELSNLKKMGLIISKEGKNGGCMLAKPAEDILISDVFSAVNSGNILGNDLANPNPKCPVGRQINAHLSDLTLGVEAVMIKMLAGETLAGFSNKFK